MGNGLIYLIENQINGKQYIGQTMDLNRRIKEHKYRRDIAVELAIDKYGWDNFTAEILKSDIPEDKLNEKESYYIGKYDTFEGRGYNCTSGGDGVKRSEMTEEMLESLVMKGEDHPKSKISKELGQKIYKVYHNTDITQKELAEKHNTCQHTMSKIVRGEHWTTEDKETIDCTKSGEDSPMYGTHHSEEVKEIIREANTNKEVSEETREKLSKALKGNTNGS